MHAAAYACYERQVGILLAQFMDFRRKEIVSLQNGVKIGYVDDILFDPETATIRAVIVYGRPKLFGLFGREEDWQIPWEEIETVGEDTILVKNDGEYLHRKPGHVGFFEKWFG